MAKGDGRSILQRWEHAVLGSALTSGQKVVALTYKTFANADGTSVYPSHQQVAERARLSVRAVEGHAPKVVAAGWLVQEAPAIPRKRGTVYRLAFPTNSPKKPAVSLELTERTRNDSPKKPGKLTEETRIDLPKKPADNHVSTMPDHVIDHGSPATSWSTEGPFPQPLPGSTRSAGASHRVAGASEPSGAEVEEVEAIIASWDEEVSSTSTSGASAASVADAPSTPAPALTTSADRPAIVTPPDAEAPPTYVTRRSAGPTKWDALEKVVGSDRMKFRAMSEFNSALMANRDEVKKNLPDSAPATTVDASTGPETDHESGLDADEILARLAAEREPEPATSRFRRRIPTPSGVPSL